MFLADTTLASSSVNKGMFTHWEKITKMGNLAWVTSIQTTFQKSYVASRKRVSESTQSSVVSDMSLPGVLLVKSIPGAGTLMAN